MNNILHCVIRRNGKSGYSLIDIRVSENGTGINGQVIKAAQNSPVVVVPIKRYQCSVWLGE